jgi:alpha-tubulin suppressor-like RCC1 family protein
MKNRKMLLLTLFSTILVFSLILPAPTGASATTSLLDDQSPPHSVVDGSGFTSSMTLAVPAGNVTPMVAAGGDHMVGLKSDGTVVALGSNGYRQCNVGNWTDIVQVAAGHFHTVGLKSDGTVVATGYNYYRQCNVSTLMDIIQVAAGNHYTVGVQSDGTVVAVGENSEGQCAVGGWADIIQVAAGAQHTVGLKSDGTVVAVGLNDSGQCDVGNWTDIVQVAAGSYHTVGLRADGTVVAMGANSSGDCDVGGWADIIQVAAGYDHTVGLKSDGTVVAVGSNYYFGQCNVGGWTDIIQVTARGYYTVGVRSDGTVVATGYNYFGQCNVNVWTDIIQVAAGAYHTVGLRADGTVVAVGWNGHWQCNVGGWTDIIQIAAGFRSTLGVMSDGSVHAVGGQRGECDVGNWTDIIQVAGGDGHTVGLKSDGTVVAVGDNRYGQCNVGGWTDIIQVAAGSYHTVGLKSDGTVVAVGYNGMQQCNVGGWIDIIQVAAVWHNTAGVKSDGTVVAMGLIRYGTGWMGITQVAIGAGHTVGLKSDGTAIAAGDNDWGQCNIGDWMDITQTSAGWTHTVGLKSDGTVVAAGSEVELSKWNLIETAPPPDTTPPTVFSISPEDGSFGVDVAIVVTATFSEAMDSSTINETSFILEGSAVSGTVTYDPATYSATFTPDAVLSHNHTYTATLSTAITDLAGNPLSAPYTWSFTTESPPVDSTPPGAVTDLIVTGTTSDSATVTWQAPGDDGNVGTATTYDIRYSASEITETNWDSAIQCVGEPTPNPAGTTETYTVTDLSPGTTYYFALKTADEVPNWSPLSNVVSVTITPPSISLTAPLAIKPSSPPYYTGMKLTANFKIANGGSTPIAISVLTVGGRDPSGIVIDFEPIRNITIFPNSSYSYKGTLLLPYAAGTYHFFCAYQTPDGNWNCNINLGPGLTDSDREEDIDVQAGYLLSSKPNESRGAITISKSVFPLGEGKAIPIFVPPVDNDSNAEINDGTWQTVWEKETARWDVDWATFWAYLFGNVEGSPNDPNVGAPKSAMFAIASGFLQSLNAATSVTGIKVIVQQKQTDLRAIIQVDDSDSSTYMRSIAGDGWILGPLVTSFSQKIYETFHLPPSAYYTFCFQVDQAHKNDPHTGYLSYTIGGELTYTPKLYANDGFKIVYAPLWVEDIFEVHGDGYLSLFERPVAKYIADRISKLLAKESIKMK